MSSAKAKVIAFYLPQYHPIPENDNWWGKGFTEWTNVGKAKPLFRGHYQPRIPADLGYYDLRVPETRKAQADMAREYGIEGFCYWHYWFGNGKRLIERPFNEVLNSKEPNFPFCLAWANETWKGFSHGLKNRDILIEQKYPGVEDYKLHFNEVLKAFKDSRYIQVDGKPLFVIYKPLDNKEINVFINVWRKLAIENGLKGIYFIGQSANSKFSIEDILKTGVDGVNTVRLDNYQLNYRSFANKIAIHARKYLRGVPQSYSYKTVSKYFFETEIDKREDIFPTLITGWDHSPRSHKEALVLTDYTPDSFERTVKEVVNIVKDKSPENRIIFVKSWNEWAEGNYLEPDMRWGKKFLEVLKKYILPK